MDRSAQLKEHLQRGRGSDRWWHRRNQDFGTRLGFFRVQAVNKRWWIIDPQGQPFISLGINHISYKGDWPLTVPADWTEEGYSPYAETVGKRYGGDDQAWAAYQAKRLRRWGFNTVGAWSSTEMFDQGLAYTMFLQISARVGVGRPERHRGEFPDVFSEAFLEGARAAAQEHCAPHREDPMLLGYFTDNEHDWDGWRRPGRTSLLEYFMAKPAAAPGKQAAVALLRERYGEASALSHAYDCDLISFEALLGMAVLTPGPGADMAAVSADRAAFLADAAENYFAKCEQAIREADPNHMILGVRFAGGAPMEVIDACGRHVDILSVNNYSYDPPVAQLESYFAATWRPIMITEWSFKAMDAGLANTKGAAIPVLTQQDRADGYERYTKAALALPFVVGLHWFQYTDQPVEGRALDGENSNYGVVDTDDEPHCALVDRMRVVNAQAMAVARSVCL